MSRIGYADGSTMPTRATFEKAPRRLQLLLTGSPYFVPLEKRAAD